MTVSGFPMVLHSKTLFMDNRSEIQTMKMSRSFFSIYTKKGMPLNLFIVFHNPYKSLFVF